MTMPINTTHNGSREPIVTTAQLEATLTRLSKEDSKLGERLINAAVAGAVLARQPADTILRAEAAEAWNSIKQVIAHHLTSEADIVIPWMKSRENFPPDLILRTCEQHLRLRNLSESVDAASFITSSDEDVIKAGTALTAFAVCLDDVIDGEERDLFPMIQRCLYEESSAPCLSLSKERPILDLERRVMVETPDSSISGSSRCAARRKR
jgi:iron-sulfur cluster repair protein YtfE (RIC family)